MLESLTPENTLYFNVLLIGSNVILAHFLLPAVHVDWWIIFVALSLIALYYFVTVAIHRSLANHITAALGNDINVQVKYNFFSLFGMWGTIVIRDIHIRSPSGFLSRNCLHVDRIDLNVRFMESVLQKRIIVRRVHIHRVVLVFEVSHNKPPNLCMLLRKLPMPSRDSMDKSSAHSSIVGDDDGTELFVKIEQARVQWASYKAMASEYLTIKPKSFVVEHGDESFRDFTLTRRVFRGLVVDAMDVIIDANELFFRQEDSYVRTQAVEGLCRSRERNRPHSLMAPSDGSPSQSSRTNNKQRRKGRPHSLSFVSKVNTDSSRAVLNSSNDMGVLIEPLRSFPMSLGEAESHVDVVSRANHLIQLSHQTHHSRHSRQHSTDKTASSSDDLVAASAPPVVGDFHETTQQPAHRRKHKLSLANIRDKIRRSRNSSVSNLAALDEKNHAKTQSRTASSVAQSSEAIETRSLDDSHVKKKARTNNHKKKKRRK